MILNVKNRWQAFGAHILLSLAIFTALLSIIVFIWYPGVYIHIGGYQGIKLIAGVDLVLGPVLTLMIFNPNKRAALMKFDLAVIAAVQFSALSAGTWLIYQERPVVQVLSNDGIYLHTFSELKRAEVDLLVIESLGDKYPIPVFLDLPTDPIEASRVKLMQEFTGNTTITLREDLYQNIRQSYPETLLRLKNKTFDEHSRCYWLKLFSIHANGDVCLEPTTFKIVKFKQP